MVSVTLDSRPFRSAMSSTCRFAVNVHQPLTHTVSKHDDTGDFVNIRQIRAIRLDNPENDR